ncbi:MAG: bile acid:sodium symporter family protein [Saprospiraceae bacterium]|nr:bile acid:sodium symporter family protein [Saprospiraceae bacterium]
MENIDAIRIHLSQDNLSILNLCLAFIMFGVALDMRISDFKRIAEYPRAVAIGLTSQLLLLPLFTVALIKVWGPYPSIALGLIMIAACPGGNISNFAVHLGRGNAALSVTMTSVVTLGAIVLTPLSFALWSRLVPETRPLLREISVDALSMVRIIVQLILIPLVIGMLTNYRFPALTRRIRRTVRSLSIVLFMAFIIFAIVSNLDNIVKYLHLVFLLVIVHNLGALAIGYYFAKGARLPVGDCKAISMETGIQNAGLGLILIFNFFGNLGGMMLVAAFWGVWDLVSSFALAVYWNRKASSTQTPLSTISERQP